MISDDTLMGTSLMTFPVQGTGWFGPGNFTAVKQKGPGHPVCSNHQSLFFWYLKFVHCSQSVASLKQIFFSPSPKRDKANTHVCTHRCASLLNIFIQSQQDLLKGKLKLIFSLLAQKYTNMFLKFYSVSVSSS